MEVLKHASRTDLIKLVEHLRIDINDEKKFLASVQKVFKVKKIDSLAAAAASANSTPSISNSSLNPSSGSASENFDASSSSSSKRMKVGGENSNEKETRGNQEQKKNKKADKGFDMSKYKERRIALHVCYFGATGNFNGFAKQNNGAVGVENVLMDALKKVRLIREEDNGHICKWSACGRTDKGVSAFGQVITLDVRSDAKADAKELPSLEDELDYPFILNRLLPEDIRVIGWAPCPTVFEMRKDVSTRGEAPIYQARFQCQSRTYRYFFVKKDLDLGVMEEAAKMLVGTHDYRNFCTIDVENVTHFNRTIHYINIKPSSNTTTGNPDDVYYVEICGNAFLYHQVRHIIAVLFYVGLNLESPNIVQDLLDVEKYPTRPAYIIASELPLILFSAQYKDLQFYYSAKSLKYLKNSIEEKWKREIHQASMTKCVLDAIFNLSVSDPNDSSKLVPYNTHPSFQLSRSDHDDKITKKDSENLPYVPFEKMKRCFSHQELINNLSQAAKTKILARHGWDFDEMFDEGEQSTSAKESI